MSVDKIGVHVTHCCVIHGCKYGDPDCPVENKKVMQEYLCEECDNPYYGDGNITMKQIEEVFNAPAGVIKPLTILEKLHAIEEHKCIYNIHYCKAGVGISFYYPERDGFLDPNSNDWKKALSTAGYHKGFDECIEAEYDIMLKEISQNDE